MKRWPKGDWGPDGLIVDPAVPLVRFTVNGEQVLEATPIELPIGYQVPEPLEVTMMRMLRRELSDAARQAGFDSLDEAYDFEMDDDDSYEDHLTPSEVHAMVHAKEMKPENPVRRKRDVRERAEGGEGEVGGAAGGSADAERGSENRGGKEPSGDRSGDAGADRSSAKSGGGKSGDRQGAGGRSSRSSVEE